MTREVNQLMDVREFVGTPGYALLVLAANSKAPNHLSAPDILRYLNSMDVGRSLTYLKKRRWLFQPPGTTNSANRDGHDARAVEIMREHLALSIRDLVALLKERGIKRQREWVRRWRVTAVAHK